MSKMLNRPPHQFPRMRSTWCSGLGPTLGWFRPFAKLGLRSEKGTAFTRCNARSFIQQRVLSAPVSVLVSRTLCWALGAVTRSVLTEDVHLVGAEVQR